MKILSWVTVALLALLNLGLAIHDFAPAGSTFGPNGSLLKAHDFLLRRNEASCVLSGIDPYKVWTREVVIEPYYPYVNHELRSERVYEPINAYTPWEYTYAVIYAAIPKQFSWILHSVLMLVSLAIITIFAYRVGGPWASAAVLAYVIPINIDINVGNYPLIITAAICGMIVCLNHGRLLTAGLLWSLAMFKPQLGLLLGIPLLIKFQWKTIAAAVLSCCILSIPPSLMTGVSPAKLILEAPAASAHAFNGCAIIPAPLLADLEVFFPANLWMFCSMFVGIVMCILLVWRIRNINDWLLLFAPCALFAVSWTYVQPHSYILTMVLAIWIVADIVNSNTAGRYAFGIPAIMLFAGFARGVEIVVSVGNKDFLPIATCFANWAQTIALISAVIYLIRYSTNATSN